MGVTELAGILQVHRSIAYRILMTLSEAGLVSRQADGRYRGASGLLHLTTGAYGTLRATAAPILRSLADSLNTTVTLFVREGDYARALMVIESVRQGFRMSFGAGWEHPLDRGAAGHAITSLQAPSPHDSEQVKRARELGYALTFGEVEPNLYGLAVPFPYGPKGFGGCVNLVSNRQDLIEASVEQVLATAQEITKAVEENEAGLG